MNKTRSNRGTGKQPYIIRYGDGTVASMYGTAAQAKKTAEKEKDSRGGRYIII